MSQDDSVTTKSSNTEAAGGHGANDGSHSGHNISDDDTCSDAGHSHSEVAAGTNEDAALSLRDVVVVRDSNRLLGPIDWTVQHGESWVVLGPNGCGKSTMFSVAGMQMHPTSGTVSVLGESLGRTDVRVLRRRIGFASAGLANSFRGELCAADVVMTAKNGALEPWWHPYDDSDRERAVAVLAARGCAHLADRAFNTLSSGERQRVVLARTLMVNPEVVLLDEPVSAIDVAARESLVSELERWAVDKTAPALAIVTHHVEEIPPSFSHALLMREGQVVTAGLIEDVLTEEALSETFASALRLIEVEGRRFAIAQA